MKALVSVIIPCYNAEKTIARTLLSVVEQNYNNFEIIIIDDGSVDQSLDIVNLFAQTDSRIKVFSQKNAGVSVARNFGLSKAQGDYIMFLDADDNYTSPFAMSKMMQRLIKAQADMVICKFIHPCYEQYLKAGLYDLTNERDFIVFLQDFFASGMPWNKIYKKECLTENFLVGVKFTEDELFNLFNLHNFKRVLVLEDVLHNYYCAPYNSHQEISAVNSQIIGAKTLWQAGMETYKYRIEAIEKFHCNLKKELQYLRSFDFFFWDIFLLIKNRMSVKYIIENCKKNYFEELFQETLKDKEKNGLKLKQFQIELLLQFVNLVYFAFIDIKLYNKNLSMFKVCASIFAKIFYDAIALKQTEDIVCICYKEVLNNSSKEAVYVNSLFSMQTDIKEKLFQRNLILWQKN